MCAADVNLRSGVLSDAARLAELVNYAGEGMPLYLWASMAGEGETAWEVGVARASRETGGFSYRNATVADRDGEPVAALIGYEIDAEPEPVPDDIPAMFRPLLELENLAPDTWYVNVLATVPSVRGQGIGGQLLDEADRLGRSAGRRGMSVIVANTNVGARRLYERHGYAERASRAMVKEGWAHDATHWVLLTKAL